MRAPCPKEGPTTPAACKHANVMRASCWSKLGPYLVAAAASSSSSESSSSSSSPTRPLDGTGSVKLRRKEVDPREAPQPKKAAKSPIIIVPADGARPPPPTSAARRLPAAAALAEREGWVLEAVPRPNVALPTTTQTQPTELRVGSPSNTNQAAFFEQKAKPRCCSALRKASSARHVLTSRIRKSQSGAARRNGRRVVAFMCPPPSRPLPSHRLTRLNLPCT